MPFRMKDTKYAISKEPKTLRSKVGIYGTVGPKSSGCQTADVAVLEMKMRSCKGVLNIGTWNVRNMLQEKLEVVQNEMERVQLDLLGVSELKWTGTGHFKSGNHMIYYVGHGQRRNGVAFIIKTNLAKTVMKYSAVSERLISIRLQGMPINTTIIQVHAPPTDAEEQEVDEFYEQIQAEIDRTCKKDRLIVMGDWNAKVGNKEEGKVVGKYGLGSRDKAGERLIEFCNTNSLFISNTFFQQHKRRLYTWTSPNGLYRDQIDYICGSQRWKNSITSAKTKPGAECGTDHKLLVCKLEPKLQMRKPLKNKAKKMAAEFLVHEKVWFDKFKYDDAERQYYEQLNGPVATSQCQQQDDGASTILRDIARARETIQKSLAGSPAPPAGADHSDLIARVTNLELENRGLHKVVGDLQLAVSKLETRLKTLEISSTSHSPAVVSTFQPQAVAAALVKEIEVAGATAAVEDDDDIDLFGSDEEEDNEAIRIREERLRQYAEKKSKTPGLIAKSSILLDVKPWDDETDMTKLEEYVRTVQMDGLVWGSSKLVPVGYGIRKLQIQCVVEDDKVGTDMLEEEITKFNEYVQSVDIAAFNKI